MSINRAPLFYQQTNADGTVVLRFVLFATFGPVLSANIYRPVSESVPPHDAMVPGKLYVRKLPGRKRPEWVRKRVPSAYSPFGFTAIAEAFGGPRAPSCSTDDSVQDIRTYSTAPNQYLHPFQFPQPLQVQSPGQTVTVTQDPGVYTQEVQAPTIVQATPGLKTTVITETGGKSVEKHTCASCGKYRSASYQLRHPLRPGEKPKAKMCKKCAKQETSSEDSDSSHKTHHKRNRKKKHYRKHSTESDESSSDKERSRRHRCRSSRHRSRRSDTRSSSVDGIRITIAKSTDEPRSRLAARRKRSPDSIRIMRHTRYMNRTEPEFHHRSRDSSDRHYTRESEARGYDGIDRVYISRREPSPRYRETEYFGGYDTVDRERPVRRRSESLLVRRRTPQGHQGHYERPSVSHVRDIDDYVGDSAYESGGSVVEIDPPRPPSRLVRVRSSPEAESRSRPRSVRAIRVAHVPDEPRRRSRSRSRSRSVRAIRVAHVSDEPRRRSRSRSVRAIRIAHVSDEPRPRSQSVRYLRVQQPDRSYESVPADEPRVFVQSRARSPTPIRRHFTETLESPRRPRRRRYREGSEFQASSEDLNVLGIPPRLFRNQI